MIVQNKKETLKETVFTYMPRTHSSQQHSQMRLVDGAVKCGVALLCICVTMVFLVYLIELPWLLMPNNFIATSYYYQTLWGFWLDILFIAAYLMVALGACSLLCIPSFTEAPISQVIVVASVTLILTLLVWRRIAATSSTIENLRCVDPLEWSCLLTRWFLVAGPRCILYDVICVTLSFIVVQRALQGLDLSASTSSSSRYVPFLV